MKRVSMIGLLQAIAFVSFGQQASLSEISTTPVEKILLVQNSVDVPSWHEKRFWSLYDKYESVNEQIALSCYRALNDFAKMDKDISDAEALDFAEKLIKFRNDQFATRSAYYGEMGNEFNGVIAFQFLQAETLIDIMESAKIYEQSRWRNFRFNRKALPTAQMKYAKYNTIVTAIDLSADKAGQFYQIYYQYEQELDAVLGEDYSMYSLFAGEPSDLTPGLAKTSGYNFLLVMKRELKLKEKYFRKMKEAVGSPIAARFLAWEDYYSLTNKMQAWLDNQ
jgi:hypothetical protein